MNKVLDKDITNSNYNMNSTVITAIRVTWREGDSKSLERFKKRFIDNKL